MSDSSPVGRNVGYIDAIERVRGQVGYALNVDLPGCLVGRLLRSPVPHARIMRIDASRAERLPGVVVVLTQDDHVDPDLSLQRNDVQDRSILLLAQIFGANLALDEIRPSLQQLNRPQKATDLLSPDVAWWHD